jgi:hypothetical protein
MQTERGGERLGEKGKNIGPLQENFERLVNKNAMKQKIGGYPWQFCPESLIPSQGVWQKYELPRPQDFQPACIYVRVPIMSKFAM